MDIRVDKKAGICHIEIAGEMTIYHASKIKNKLIPALEGCEKVEISLAGVSEIDTSGLQLLALAKREAAEHGQQLVFFEHSHAVLAVLDLCNLAGVFGDPLVISPH